MGQIANLPNKAGCQPAPQIIAQAKVNNVRILTNTTEIGYLAPADKLVGHEREIFAAHDLKLSVTRERRKIRQIENDTQMVTRKTKFVYD